MRTLKTLLSTIAILSAGLCQPATAVPLITDGNFANPNVAGTYQYVGPGQVGTGPWTYSGSNGPNEGTVINTNSNQGFGMFSLAAPGSQFAVLQSNNGGNTPGTPTISQAYTLAAPQLLELQFDAGARTNDTFGTQAGILSVYLNPMLDGNGQFLSQGTGTLLDTVALNSTGVGGSLASFQDFTFFDASTTNVLAFTFTGAAAANGNGDNSAFLDNVSLTGVPEVNADTAVLPIALSLFSLLFVSDRRSRKAKT